jgi:CheY-like chemotaxis protein
VARILVIDDDVRVRSWLRPALEGIGHSVAEARDGAEGLAAYRREPADLVLCDLFMPAKDGLEAIRELRNLDPVARVVAMSGGGRFGLEGAELLAVARRLGAARVLLKPFGVDAVRAAVDDVLALPAPVGVGAPKSGSAPGGADCT